MTQEAVGNSWKSGARLRTLAAALGVACVAIVPSAAQAGGLVVPQAAAPITPHAALPPAAPAPTATPSPAPAPAPGTSDGSGSGSRYPFPKGIPNWSDPDCEAEVSCEQEWYAYYSAREREAKSSTAPDPGDLDFYKDKKKDIGAKIEAQGADPEALIDKGDDSADGGGSSSNTPNASDTSSQAQTATPTPVAVATDIAVDAITGATPILKPDPMQGWAIGEYELDLPDWLMAVLNGNVCRKATKSDGKVVTCVD